MEEMPCPLCGVGGKPVHVMESWAGKWQATCSHSACEGCLRSSVEAQLGRCRREGLLRILCPHDGCQRYLPQRLVFQVSRSAQGLAMEIDMQIGNLDERYRGMPINWAREVCGVCCDYVGPRIQLAECRHEACEDCWSQWVDEHIPSCRAARELRVRCLGAGCQTVFDNKMAHTISAKVREFKRDMARRSRLQANPLYPAEVQVDCPIQGCVGLGYLGFETVMCFLCEHQWDVMAGEAPDEELPGTIKACPRCAVRIEKNGGCNHMTCRCGHEFWWSTLTPFRLGHPPPQQPQPPQPQPPQQPRPPQQQPPQQPPEDTGQQPQLPAGAPPPRSPRLEAAVPTADAMPEAMTLVRAASAPLAGGLHRAESATAAVC